MTQWIEFRGQPHLKTLKTLNTSTYAEWIEANIITRFKRPKGCAKTIRAEQISLLNHEKS